MQSTSSTTHTTTSPSVYSQAELVRSQQNNPGSYQTETESIVSLVRAEPNAAPYIIDQTRHHSELRECTENYWTLTQCNLLVHPMM